MQPKLKAFTWVVAERPEVRGYYLMTGTADNLPWVVVAHLREFGSFVTGLLARFPGIGSFESSFALKQVRYQRALPLRDAGG